jgi:hypothetical protein
MPSPWVFRAIIALPTLPALSIALGTIAAADMHNPLEKRPGADPRTKEQKIAIAMSAGPPEIAKEARIIEVDESGKTEVLRNGTNGFTCTPGHGDTHPAMCADQASMQWFEDAAAHRPKPTNTVPGMSVPLFVQLHTMFPEVVAVNALYTHGLVVIVSTKTRYGGFAKAVGMGVLTTRHS